MSRRRPPVLPQDAALWDVVASTVEPLHRRRPARIEAPAAEAEKPAAKTLSPPAATRTTAKASAPAKAPALAPFDRRSRARLTRGSTAIEGRIDLHGLTQAAAHGRLLRFLRKAQDDGARVVLVITGKGKPSDADGAEERGVLKRMVPAWLSAPDLRTIVLGFEAAGRAHGGEGALYVRIRRAREN